jgi:hypothetical protein
MSRKVRLSLWCPECDPDSTHQPYALLIAEITESGKIRVQPRPRDRWKGRQPWPDPPTNIFGGLPIWAEYTMTVAELKQAIFVTSCRRHGDNPMFINGADVWSELKRTLPGTDGRVRAIVRTEWHRVDPPTSPAMPGLCIDCGRPTALTEWRGRTVAPARCETCQQVYVEGSRDADPDFYE